MSRLKKIADVHESHLLVDKYRDEVGKAHTMLQELSDRFTTNAVRDDFSLEVLNKLVEHINEARDSVYTLQETLKEAVDSLD